MGYTEKIIKTRNLILDIIENWSKMSFEDKERFITTMMRVDSDILARWKERFVDYCLVNNKLDNSNSQITTSKRFKLKENHKDLCEKLRIDPKLLHKEVSKSASELREVLTPEEFNLLVEVKLTKPHLKLKREREKKNKEITNRRM